MTCNITTDDNLKIMLAACRSFLHILNTEEIHDVLSMALAKALNMHRNGLGNKFTTSLYRFTKWECLRAARNKKRERARAMAPIEIEPVARTSSRILDDIYEHMSTMSVDDARVLRQYYLQNMTVREIAKVNGYSRGTAVNRIESALEELRCIIK